MYQVAAPASKKINVMADGIMIIEVENKDDDSVMPVILFIMLKPNPNTPQKTKMKNPKYMGTQYCPHRMNFR
jgi:hypothetical protein